MSLGRLFFDNMPKVMNINGKIIPVMSHHFEPKSTISSWIPEIKGTFDGVIKINKLKQITKLSDAIMIGKTLFFFIVLR